MYNSVVCKSWYGVLAHNLHTKWSSKTLPILKAIMLIPERHQRC